MKKTLLAALGAVVLVVLFLAIWVVRTLSDLPDVTALKHYRPAAASEVMDRDGRILAHYYDRKFRIWTPIASIPDSIIQAVVTAEDDTFFGHQGINYKAVWDALRHDVQKKRFARGGSTITQQMIKNVLLSKEKTLTRKLREFVLARKAEEVLTKRQILEIYLNEVEWGENIYGIEAAGRYYFDKRAAELTRAETALLAGMLPNPRYYDPYKRMDKARQRQEQVLFNMFQAKLMTQDEYGQAMDAPVTLRDASSRRFDLSMLSPGSGRPCHLKALEEVLLAYVGEQGLYREGLTIRTTIDKSIQDSLIASSPTGTVPPDAALDRVLLLKEGNEIRALTCEGHEDQARFFVSSLGTPNPVYEIITGPLKAIRKDDIIAPEPSAPKPAADASTGPGRER
ncbi:MAG: transglycosylase domain-containing protein [Nitrospirota bacterium]